MGLDNGICVKRNYYTTNIKELQIFEDSWDKEHKWDFEVCYWRKCWNIRNDILWSIDSRFDDQYEFKLTSENIGNIIIILMSYNEENWGNSIWEFEAIKEHLQQDIKNLQILQDLMEKYELEVYFYDSY